MKKAGKAFLCLVLILLTHYLNAGAQNSATAIGHITAEVIPVYSAFEKSQLNFGRFSPGPQGGELIITPLNTVSVMGSVRTSIGLHNAASFYVTGDADASFTISLPSEPVILKHVHSAKTMLIEKWVSDPGTETGAGILQNGERIVYVGATLKVGTVQDNPVGTYAGTFAITFDFN